jgi:hypothetical protein
MENVMKKFLPFAALVVAMTFAASAKAATITFMLPFGPIPVTTANGVIGSLSLFDPDLGTLTNVELSLDVTTTDNSIIFDNEAGSGGSVTLGVGATVTAQDGGMNLSALIANPNETNMGTVDADNDAAADFVGSDSLAITGGMGTDSDSDSSMVGGVLAAFTGAGDPNPVGTFNVTLGSSIDQSLSTSGAFGPQQVDEGTISGTITVTYTYDDGGIPTPAALPAGLALMGMLGLRRRRA